MGVNTTWMKLKAFAVGAFIAGWTGAIFASFQDSVFPNNFDFPQLVIVYCMVILGGLGNVPGVIVGAVFLSILPEFLREYGAYRMMTYGLILIVLMALRPEGIMGSLLFSQKGEKGLTRMKPACSGLPRTCTIRAKKGIRPSDKRLSQRGTVWSSKSGA